MGWLEQVELEVTDADIFSVEAQAVAAAVTRELDAYGAISRKAYTLGGQELKKRINTAKQSLKDQRLSLGEAASVCLHDIPGFRADYLVLVVLWDSYNDYTNNLFYHAYISTLRQCLRLRIETVVFPVMAYHNSNKTVPAICKCLHDLDSLPGSDTFSINAITFASHREAQLFELKTQLAKLIQ